jgi:DNA-binding CsgD family transcriptional regulator
MKKNSSPSIYDTVVTMARDFFAPISSKHEENIDVEEDFSIDLNLDELKKLHSGSPTVVFIFNHKTMSYDFFSENIKDVMGHSNEEFSNGGLEFAMSLVHPDHTKIYNRHVLPIMFKYYMTYAFKGKNKDLRFSYTFKIKKKNGEYMWALHHMNAIKTNRLGFPILTLLHMVDVTTIKVDDKINLTVSIKEEDEFFKPIYSRIFSPQNSFSFSDRELEILELIAQGKTSEEISKTLAISKHTVITHRRNMLEKSKVKNSSELIQLAYRQNMIKEGSFQE